MATDSSLPEEDGGIEDIPRRRGVSHYNELRASRASKLRQSISANAANKSVSASHSDRVKQAATADFIRLAAKPADDEWMPSLRRRVHRFLKSDCVAALVAGFVLLDALCNIMDIDSRAADTDTPDWVSGTAHACFVVYVAEITVRVYAKRRRFFDEKIAYLDILILMAGVLEYILAIAELQLGVLPFLRLLRLARGTRLFRLLPRFRWLGELRKMVQMTTACLKTLCWSFVFCSLVVVLWSMLIVEFVYPESQEVFASRGLDDSDCPEGCLVVFSSIMRTSLWLFKAVITGDSWGSITVPLMLDRPWTALIFIPSFLSIVFGILNLNVAVVVDLFSEQRSKDYLYLAGEMDVDREHDLRDLRRTFRLIDDDNDGQLTFEELVEAAKTVPEFQNRLQVMDIDQHDLEQLFIMLDMDGSGGIETEEFIVAMNRWVQDSKSAMRFVKYQLLQSMEQQDRMGEQIVELTALVKKSALVRGKDMASERASRTFSETTSILPPSELSGPKISAPCSNGDNFIAFPKGAENSEAVLGFSHKSEALKSAIEEVERDLHEALERAIQTLFKSMPEPEFTENRGTDIAAPGSAILSLAPSSLHAFAGQYSPAVDAWAAKTCDKELVARV